MWSDECVCIVKIKFVPGSNEGSLNEICYQTSAVQMMLIRSDEVKINAVHVLRVKRAA